MLIQKLALLVLLLQQLVVQLGQQNAQPISFSVKPSVPRTVSVPVPKIETPIITKVEPDKGAAGTVIKITGSGFDREGNTVYTGAGIIAVASSDGKTLSFTLPRPPFLTGQWLSNTANYRRERYGSEPIIFPLGFYVKNARGVTASPGLFSLTI